MNNLIATVFVSALALASTPLLAQEKKEPVKEEAKSAEVKKAEAKKDAAAKTEGKKKVRKGGC